MASIFVIGAASLDTLHVHNQIHATPGGAGLYTALAAAVAGADVTLFAPKPDVTSGEWHEPLKPIAERIEWIGPTVDESWFPRLEIAHHGDGKATLLGASWGAVDKLPVDKLPDDLSLYDYVHVAALPTAQRQVAFVRACRQRNAATISVGTYAKVVAEDTLAVRVLLFEADLFFMNENEANGLFGSIDQVEVQPGRSIFVTRDRDGALYFNDDGRIAIPGNPVDEVDPTGAGDTFCGTTLAGLAQGLDVVEAAQNGCRMAARTVQGIGPSGLS